MLPGLCVAAFGVFVASIAAGYPYGSALRPGPGFFPLAIGVILMVLGLCVGIEDWRYRNAPAEADEDDAQQFALRPMLATVSAVLAFALLLETLGYIPASIALVLIAALGEARRNWITVGAIAAFMAVFGTAVFIWGLGLPISPFETL